MQGRGLPIAYHAGGNRREGQPSSPCACDATMPLSRVLYSLQENAMEKDVVCGMDVDPAKAAATSEYNGKTYYFCAKICKTKFDANPSQYVK